MLICMQQADHLLHKHVYFSGSSINFLVGIQGWNEEHSHEKLIACGKVMVDKDEWITIQEIVEALDISFGEGGGVKHFEWQTLLHQGLS